MKLLEIGLGCDYTAGNAGRHRTHAKSARLWRTLAPHAELWEAEYDFACVQANQHLWADLNISTLVGDQGNRSTLEEWVRRSGGEYTAVIDDGSHRNADIMAAFTTLWPHVRPGGFYFIEDLHVGRHAAWDTTRGEAVVSDVMQSWVEQMLVSPRYAAAAGCYSRLKGPPSLSGVKQPLCPDAKAAPHVRAQEMRARHPLPKCVAFVFCQTYGCVVGKRASW